MVQLFATLYQNSVVWDLPRAVIIKAGDGFVIGLIVQGKFKADYQDSISTYEFFVQSHPFIVTSCEEGKRKGSPSVFSGLPGTKADPMRAISVWHCSQVPMGPAFLWGDLEEFSWSLRSLAQLPYLREPMRHQRKEDALNDSYIRKLQISSRD